MCLEQRAARQHGRELLAIVRRRMDVVDRVDLAQAFANLAHRFFGHGPAEQSTLDVMRADRSRSHAAKRQRCARHLAALVLFEKRRRRDDGAIAMAAKSIARMPLLPKTVTLASSAAATATSSAAGSR